MRSNIMKLRGGSVRLMRVMSALILSIVTIFMAISLMSYHRTDPSWLHGVSNASTKVANLMGAMGAQCAATILYVFGVAAYLLIPFLLYLVLLIAIPRFFIREIDRVFAAMGFIVAFASFEQLVSGSLMPLQFSGGLLGRGVVHLLSLSLELWAVYAAVLCLMWVSLVMITRLWLIVPMRYTYYGIKDVLVFILPRFVVPVGRTAVRCVRFSAKKVYAAGLVAVRLIGRKYGFGVVQTEVDELYRDSFWTDMTGSYIGQRVDVREQLNEYFELSSSISTSPKSAKNGASGLYRLPRLERFSWHDQKNKQLPSDDEEEARTIILEEKLQRFGVTGSVISIRRGPVVTLYEYQPNIDIKISKIIALEDDLALALQATSIRIIAPIPGTSLVGFEVANKERNIVEFSKLAMSQEFKRASARIPLILGEDPIGNNIIIDLVRMPHLLIAGSTGSGKSMQLNVILTSMISKLSPDELKLILIDPKRLEFATYADIPHLLVPIVTQPTRAIAVLRWVVKTMEERYELLARAGVRTLAEFQQKVKEQQNDELREVPHIVVVIDELADLMMTAGKDIEELIVRIAQMARAAGIHLIVATQRPSVDVITGLIKVNFPSRISFRVVSKTDSRTILDCGGADKLLGSGDMLFLDAHSSGVRRVHGAYIAHEDIVAITAYARSQRVPSYIEIEDIIPVSGGGSLVEEDNVLYGEILSFLDTVDEVSISLLQRRFRIGFNRSARIIELLESQGHIISTDGGKMRKVIRKNISH